MVLFLARHGNTFEADETPRIVGAHEDLALTAKGEEQARVLGQALLDAGVRLDAIYTGPLIRTKRFAGIVAEITGFSGRISVDERLRELDFGPWSGLSDAEIAQRFGLSALEDWRLRGHRPADAGWSPSETMVRASLADLATEAAGHGSALCVTSNGALRYAMELDPEAFAAAKDNGGFRVKTGRLCALRKTSSAFQIILWDAIPSAAQIRTVSA